MATGDRVIFKLPNQRVDKKDLEDLSVLSQDALSRAIGSLIGDTSGVLTNIPYEWDPAEQILTLGTFVLAWGSPFRRENNETVYSPENYLEGGVLIHDPTRPGQAGWSELDLGAAPNKCHLWFRREETETDDDNRAYWPGDSEQVTVTKTRKRETAVFSFSETAVDPILNPSNGWFRFAEFYKSGPAGDAPYSLIPLSAFGDNKPVEDTALLNLLGSSFMGIDALGTTPRNRRPWGLGRLTQEVILSILRAKDSQIAIDTSTRAITSNPNSTTWKGAVPRGLVQLDRDLNQVSADVTDLWDNATTQRPGVLATIVHNRVFNTEGGDTTCTTGFYKNYLDIRLVAYEDWGGGSPSLIFNSGGSSSAEASSTDSAHWWFIELSPIQNEFPGLTGGLLTPENYDSAVVTSVLVQPHHPAVWTSPDTTFPGGSQDEDLVSTGAVAELQQWKTFPVELTPDGTPQKLKLRWRSLNGNKQRPDRGWTMTIMGYLKQSTQT
jgi:hypothetical protein